MGDGGRDHIPGLDGLRGVAVATVVAYHLGHLRGGFVGVDLFFVLSGFLITSLLLDRTPETAAELRSWWARRWRRLTPAVAVVVLATLVIFSTAGLATDTLGLDAIATLTWWQNWHQLLAEVSYWSPDASPLRHAWSLAIEEQFYLLWPIVVLASAALARRRGWATRSVVGVVACVGTVASFAWAATLASRGADLSRIYFGTDTRAGALLLGCAAAAFVDGRPTPQVGRRGTGLSILAAAALVALSATLDPSLPATYRWGLPLAALASLVLILGASFEGPVESALSRRPLRWLGERSYAIYLWSWPVQLLAEQRWAPGSAAVAAVTAAASLLLADVSFRVVERPLRLRAGWASAVAPRRGAWLGGAAAIVVAVALVGVTAEPPTGIDAVSTEESAELALRPPPTTTSTTTTSSTTTTTLVPTRTSNGAVSVPPPTTAAPTTTTTTPPPRLRLAVFGDSVAFSSTFIAGPEELHPAGIEIADGRGLIGCWLLSGDGWQAYEKNELKRPHPLCASQREGERIALGARPDWVVHFSGGWEGTTFIDPSGRRYEPQSPAIRAVLLAELIERGREAAAAGARIAWPAWVCPGAESWLWFADGYAGWYNDLLREASRSVPGSIVIEPTDRVCQGADANGRPTAEKDAAWRYEHHPFDGAWLWQVWLGPALWAAEGRQNPG